MKAWFVTHRKPIVAGLLGAACMAVYWFIVRLLFGLATPSELFLDRGAPFINVYLFGTFINLFGGYTHLKELGFLSVVLGELVVGILGALLYAAIAKRRDPRIALAGFGTFALLLWIAIGVVLAPQLTTQYFGAAATPARVANLLDLFIGVAIYAVVTLALLRMDEYAPARGRAGASRARFVTNALSAVVAFAGAGSLFALFRRTAFSYDGTPYIGPDVKPITPNDRFYQVTKNVIDPDVALANWELQVGGMVASAQTLTLGNIRAFRNVEQETTLNCISNPVGGGLMSNAIWKGVPLAALLDVVKPASDGTRVLLHAADGYTDTIELKKAMERTTLLAYEMNSETLPRRHGFPVRMIVPGLFGEKSVKWLTGIEIVPDTVQGFYQKQGWGPDFVIPTQSRIDVPGPMDRLRSGAPVELKGVAFGGHRGISAVDVSTDGGRSWSPAQITYPATLLRWALWKFQWRPKSSGSYELVVRAKAANGEPQIATDRPTATQGSTGYHRVKVAVA